MPETPEAVAVFIDLQMYQSTVLPAKRAHKRMQKLKAQREAKLTNNAHTIDVAAITSGT
jgi:hypothetical protein